MSTTVDIHYTNGSIDIAAFRSTSFRVAQEWAQKHISYSGGRVKRVECVHTDGSRSALWDASWDPISQHAGLYR